MSQGDLEDHSKVQESWGYRRVISIGSWQNEVGSQDWTQLEGDPVLRLSCLRLGGFSEAGELEPSFPDQAGGLGHRKRMVYGDQICDLRR